MAKGEIALLHQNMFACEKRLKLVFVEKMTNQFSWILDSVCTSLGAGKVTSGYPCCINIVCTS